MDASPAYSAIPAGSMRRSWVFLPGVFLICMSALMLQIVETRIISVLLWYHLAFFAISMAMLGMTAGSLLVYFKSQWFPREQLLGSLAWIAVALAISIVLSMIGLITTIVPTGLVNTLAMTVLIWGKLIAMLLPPYVLAGMAIALALTRSPWPVGMVYFIDLAGAAFGCLIVLAFMTFMDALSVLLATAALAACAAVCFAQARRSEQAPASTLAIGSLGRARSAVLLAAVLGFAALLNALAQPTSVNKASRDGLVLLMSKGLTEFIAPDLVRWNTFSRVKSDREIGGMPAMWGASVTMPNMSVRQHSLNIDGSAGTSLYEFDGNVASLDFLHYDVTNLAYSIRTAGRSAVIGVGGGRDIMSAYAAGFRDITGVELNPIFISLLQDEYRDFNKIASMPGVKFHVDDARSWFARTDEQFDLIEMSLVDTWAATGAGAFSLSENGLYTAQGWAHFIRALKPTGVFTVSRWFSPSDVTETGRLLSLAAGSLRNAGISDPEKHIFVSSTSRLATLVLSKAPFTAEDLAKLRARSKELQFTVLLDPDGTANNPFMAKILAADSPEALAVLTKEYHVDVSVTTDQRPFFFNPLNMRDIESIKLAFQSTGGVLRGNLVAFATLAIIILVSGVLVVVTVLIPAIPALRRGSRQLVWVGTPYFLLIGLGLMFVEIGLIQRLSTFLGHPVYGMAIGLFGIILSTGLGSLASERVPLSSGKRIALWGLALSLYVVLLPFWFPALVAAFEGHSLPVRAAVSMLAIVPSGLMMGFAFPTGMRLANAVDDQTTPWLWAINGAAGVLAAGIAVATSIIFSIDVSLWVGAGCYLLMVPFALGLRSLGSAGAIGVRSDGVVRAA